jgi:Kef-type K+ transport system membrane component KefB
MLIGSALTTERIGIHALFGAFLIGVVMPREPDFRAALVQRLEEVSAILFLPLFFAFTGLRTQIGLLDSAEGWLMCLAVVAVATLGKLGGSMAAARLSGMGTLDAFSLGALMNTRGLMELIVLNVGYEMGILSPRIFAMMVLMALVTTFSTAPLLALADLLRKRREADALS